MTALDAQRAAHCIAFAPMVFQVSRLMIRYGIFDLLESSLTAGTFFCDGSRFTISKVGWFLLNDPMVRADIDFNHDINYKGLYHLDEAIKTGKPAGLKELGDWPTLYEGLSSLSPEEKKSWFGFDHFYSDNSFEEALPYVLSDGTATILDIGGNTGRFALKCVSENPDVNVTVMDLPQQIAMLEENISGKPGAERIHTYPGNLLDKSTSVPGGFDVVWMSQFLDCFSEEQVVSILERVAAGLKPDARIYIMETLWDRQRYDTASFDLAQTSVYFTVMANGNSKMFYGPDLERMIDEAGLKIYAAKDNLGYGHSLIRCIKK